MDHTKFKIDMVKEGNINKSRGLLKQLSDYIKTTFQRLKTMICKPNNEYMKIFSKTI